MEIEKLYDLAKDPSMNIKQLTNIIEKNISSLKTYSTFYIPDFKENQLYRCRSHHFIDGDFYKNVNKPFSSEIDFCNPPKSPNIKMGRCNDNGESLLYCSNELKTAILETNIENRNFISISKYLLIENEIKNSTLVASLIGIQYLSKIDERFKRPHLINKDYNFFKFDNFLDELFHKKVSEDEKYLYKLSNAIAKCIMNDILVDSIDNNDKLINRELIQQDCMIYPSIVRDKRSCNFVFRPQKAREKYNLFEVNTYEILINNENIISLQLRRIGYKNNLRSDCKGFSLMNWINIDKSSKKINILKNYD